MAEAGSRKRLNHASFGDIGHGEDMNNDCNRTISDISVKDDAIMPSLQSKRSKISQLSDDRLEIAKALFLKYISVPNSSGDRYVDIIPSNLSLALRCWKIFKVYTLTYGYHARRRKLTAAEMLKDKSKRDKFIISVLKVDTNVDNSVSSPFLVDRSRMSTYAREDKNISQANDIRENPPFEMSPENVELASTPVYTNGDPKFAALYSPTGICSTYSNVKYGDQADSCCHPMTTNNGIIPCVRTECIPNNFRSSEVMPLHSRYNLYCSDGTTSCFSSNNVYQSEFRDGSYKATSYTPVQSNDDAHLLNAKPKDSIVLGSDVSNAFDSSLINIGERSRSSSLDFDAIFDDYGSSQHLFPASCGHDENCELESCARSHSYGGFQTDNSYCQSNNDWCLVDIGGDVNTQLMSKPTFSGGIEVFINDEWPHDNDYQAAKFSFNEYFHF